jgi:hypothetical protein
VQLEWSRTERALARSQFVGQDLRLAFWKVHRDHHLEVAAEHHLL